MCFKRIQKPGIGWSGAIPRIRNRQSGIRLRSNPGAAVFHQRVNFGNTEIRASGARCGSSVTLVPPCGLVKDFFRGVSICCKLATQLCYCPFMSRVFRWKLKNRLGGCSGNTPPRPPLKGAGETLIMSSFFKTSPVLENEASGVRTPRDGVFLKTGLETQSTPTSCRIR